jgi:hypothetical protein
MHQEKGIEMKKHVVSKTVHIAIAALMLAFIAIAASCIEETARTSDQPLGSCAVFADYDFFDAASQTEFDATYADYAHLFDGTLSESDILSHRQQRLGSLDELRQHYQHTFVKELPALVKDAFSPDWNAWTEWRIFSDKFGQGDELWYFALPASNVDRHTPRRGYVIVRDGQLHAMLLNRTVVFHASYADYVPFFHGVATVSQVLAWKQQQFDSLESLRQHHNRHFGSDSARIVLEPDCRLGQNTSPQTKWDHWHVFGRSYRTGDQLWYFESPAQTWTDLAGRCGYFILRDGQLLAMILVAIN